MRSSTTLAVDWISGSTQLFGIVGDPITQVRSPEMFTAVFRSRGHDAILVPLHARPDDFERSVRGILALANLGGLVFTIPYKARATMFADALGPQARVVGAINALARDHGGWKGEIFDGLGCVEAFRRRGIPLAGRRIMLIGAGGAGQAVAVAIAGERPAAMRVFDIDDRRADALASKLAGVDATIAVEVGAPRVEDADVLLNVSPVGMLDDARVPVDVERLPPALVVFDAVVKPDRTPLLALAEASGCTTVYGREMMRGQVDRVADFFFGPR
jgi:shikimate dehydrogenase